MSCVWVLQRGHSGDGCDLALTLCKYDLRKGAMIDAGKYLFGSNNNSLQVLELSGYPNLQIVVNTSLQTVSSTVFRTRVSLQRLS